MFAVLGDTGKGGPVAFAEGYATGASVHQATGLPVIVTFSVGNKEKVMTAWREREPRRMLIDAADNDHAKERLEPPKPNAGRAMAEKLQAEIGSVPALPPFKPHEAGSDWNDYHRAHGAEAVRQAMHAAVRAEAERGGAVIGMPAPVRPRPPEREVEH